MKPDFAQSGTCTNDIKQITQPQEDQYFLSISSALCELSHKMWFPPPAPFPIFTLYNVELGVIPEFWRNESFLFFFFFFVVLFKNPEIIYETFSSEPNLAQAH